MARWQSDLVLLLRWIIDARLIRPARPSSRPRTAEGSWANGRGVADAEKGCSRRLRCHEQALVRGSSVQMRHDQPLGLLFARRMSIPMDNRAVCPRTWSGIYAGVWHRNGLQICRVSYLEGRRNDSGTGNRSR